MYTKKKRLGIVIPVYNEEDIIEKVIYDWLTVAKKFNGFLIIINDGSTDNSIKILEKLKKINNRVLVINKKNSGHGPTVYMGYKIALKRKFNFIFQVDSDDQFFIKDFIKLWSLKDKNSLILGFRKKRYDSFHRLIITRVLKLFNFIFFKKYIYDANVPYRLMGYNFLKNNIKFVNSKSDTKYSFFY